MPAEVSRAERTEKRAGHGVEQHVPVGMTLEPALERDPHSSEHQGTPGDEPVRVPAVADP